jgi:hypothetical protein
LQYFNIAVGIGEGGNRAFADMFIDADRLAGPSSTKLSSGKPSNTCLCAPTR